MTEATIKAFVLEYAKVHNLDPVDVGMVAGALISEYIQGRPECLQFVMEMKQEAPDLFEMIKLVREGADNDNSKRS